MRQIVKAKDFRGFTLMELVVVLAVIAILAAILTPMINGYVDRARNAAAQNDLKNIATAITHFNTDMKFWPIYTSAFTGNNLAGATDYTVLSSSAGGDAAIGTTTCSTTCGTDWSGSILSSAGSLDAVMNSDYYSNVSTHATTWKGPYVQLGADPWGSKYYLTSDNLKPGSTNHAYVLSAGPNGSIETKLNQGQAGGNITPGGDDLLVQIR